MYRQSIVGSTLFALAFLSRLLRWVTRRRAARVEAIVAAATVSRAKISLNAELVCCVRWATTTEELSALVSEIRSRENELFGDDFVNLLERVKVRSQELEAAAALID